MLISVDFSFFKINSYSEKTFNTRFFNAIIKTSGLELSFLEKLVVKL